MLAGDQRLRQGAVPLRVIDSGNSKAISRADFGVPYSVKIKFMVRRHNLL
jgi:hypothetical protein